MRSSFLFQSRRLLAAQPGRFPAGRVGRNLTGFPLLRLLFRPVITILLLDGRRVCTASGS